MRHFVPFVELFVANPLDELVGELVLHDADGHRREFMGIVQSHRAVASAPKYLQQGPAAHAHRWRGVLHQVFHDLDEVR